MIFGGCTPTRTSTRSWTPAARSARIDADTYTAPDSWRRRAARGRWARSQAVEARARAARRALTLLRPPGHHAEPSRAMGFCLLANGAIAVRRAPRRCTASAGWRSSTGTCTTATARRRCSTRTRPCCAVSLHQYPLWPMTGEAHETRARRGCRHDPQRAAAAGDRAGRVPARASTTRCCRPSSASRRSCSWSPAGSTRTRTTRSPTSSCESDTFGALTTRVGRPRRAPRHAAAGAAARGRLRPGRRARLDGRRRPRARGLSPTAPRCAGRRTRSPLACAATAARFASSRVSNGPW